ncbi:MAG TPA: hypothetical protein VG455_12185 [Acidimicrobiales bacterium]|nr:hypothetical protein [Acidimicrobiales bacterium]
MTEGSTPGAQAAAHLQAAALEVIAAVRALLDAAEEVVRDPSRVAAAASSMAGRARAGGDGDEDEGVQRIPVS